MPSQLMKKERGLLLILIAYLVLASWYSVTIPLGEAPDEAPHYSLIRYVARERGYPTGEEEHEAFQPPLYYALGALATFWIDAEDFVIKANSDFSFTDPEAPQNLLLHTRAESFPYKGWALAWHLVRLLSVIMGAVTVGATYALAREIFPRDRSIALGSAALNAFIPQFLFISGVANNDNLAAMLSSLILILMVGLMKGKGGPRSPLLLGFLLGLGVLTKMSLLAFIPTALVVIVLLARRLGLRQGAKISGAVFIPFLLISGPWFLRNQTLYGDPWGWAQVIRLNAPWLGPFSAAEWLDFFSDLYRSFWLSWIGIELDGLVHVVLALGVLISLGGVGLLVLGRKELEPPAPLLLSLLALQTVLVFAALLRWATVVDGADQARLLYPALSPMVLFLFLGWRRWVSGEHGLTLAYGVGVGMFLLAIITPIRYIAPLYAPPPRLALSQLEGIENREGFQVGDQIRLLGYVLGVQAPAPGETLPLFLYWQALEDVDRDYWLLIQILDEADQPLLTKDSSLSAGRYATDLWKEGDIFSFQHRLYLPPDVPPGRYRLELGIHPFSTWEWLPIRDEKGTILGEKITLTEVRVIPR